MATQEVCFRVGQRVMSLSKEKDKGPKIGCVKYVGCVQGYQGPWVGVDWDDGEGRHNGVVNGVRYFEASGDNSGAFVRAHTLSAGRTLLEAVVSRYKGETTDAKNNDDMDSMYLLSTRQKRVAVELVGREKIEKKLKHLEELKIASLVYEGISSAGELQNVLPSLEQLDLTGNLIHDWHVVSHICGELPALKVLDLSRNRLQLCANSFQPFMHLQTLVLNHCQIKWKQVEALKHSLNTLEELHLCENRIESLELEGENLCVEGLKSLRLLNLGDNHIKNWEEIMKLSNLESLEQLQACNNKMKGLFYPTVGSNETTESGDRPPFASLRSLLLAGNCLNDWASVDALNLFPNLKEVRLSDNPLTDLDMGGAPRYILVARLTKIAILNGSEIKPKERKDSEIRYVHHVMSLMPTSSAEERTKVHPRFLELKETHDLEEEHVQSRKAGGARKMTNSLRAVTLVCVAPSIGEKAPSVMKLPLSTTISKLKLVAESVYKLKATKQRLFLRDQDSPVPMQLNEDLATLGDIGLGADMTILIDELTT